MHNLKPFKLNVWEIIKQSLIFYKQNTFLMLAISSWSLLCILFELGMKSFFNFTNIWINDLIMILIHGWIHFALYAAIITIINKEAVQYSKILLSPKTAYWRYMKSIVLFGLIITCFIIPLIVIFVLMKLILHMSSTISSITLIITMAGIFLYFYTTYYFSPFMIAAEGQDTKALKNSRQIVKGGFWSVCFLAFITCLIALTPYFILKIVQLYQPISKDFIYHINRLVSIVTLPFTTINTVFAYREINTTSSMDTLLSSQTKSL